MIALCLRRLLATMPSWTALAALLCGGTTLAEETVVRTPSMEAPPPEVYGWIEPVMLDPKRRWLMDAKLDTGADTSSLDARDIKRVRFRGQSYVRFTLVDPQTGEEVSLRRPFVRNVRIRRHNGEHQRRRVALMNVCLGSQERMIEVTLVDRGVFDYPLLLGRSALRGLAIVDPTVERTREPTCWPDEALADEREPGSTGSGDASGTP